jgi:hypothetical protein
MHSLPVAPGQFAVKAGVEIAFSGVHGLVLSRIRKGAEEADVRWDMRQ